MEEEQAPQPSPEVILGAILQMDNIAENLEETGLAGIAEDVCREHAIDWKSMEPWRERMRRGVELASLVKKDKNYPFDSAANVKYPLITTAALQFNARAYPAVVPSDDIVKVKTFGKDVGGRKSARADRVSAHMSWMLGSRIEEWEEVTDELLTVLPIVGTLVKKVWFDPTEGRPRVRLIQPGSFVINASVKVQDDAPRIGEVLPLYPSEIKARRLSGFYRDIEYVENVGDDKDKVQEFIEQHRRLDLDGDGYGEPYIVTVHRESRKVARIVADFARGDVKFGQDGKVVAIKRGSYFVAYHFLPPIDGGFFGTGLGFLLGDISETINSVINMMMDAGHMASRGGGFIGSEFRIKGGAQQFKPGEWKLVQARGAEVKNSIVPMTFPGPDATLFQLLGLLIEAGKEVASVKDVMTGDTGGRNMTATTTLALIEQGMTVFTAAYKRIYRSLKREFKLIGRIVADTMTLEEYSAFHDQVGPDGQPIMVDPMADYNAADMDIEPVADPRSVTRMQGAAKAEVIMQMAREGLVDKAAASQRILQASSIPDTDELQPKPDPMQEILMKMQIEAARADLALKTIAIDKAIADVQKARSETIRNVSSAAAQDATAQLDEIRAALEVVRDGLGQAVGRGAGGMAGAPGFGGDEVRIEAIPVGPGGGGDGGLLGGQPMVGSGQAFAPQGAGFA